MTSLIYPPEKTTDDTAIKIRIIFFIFLPNVMMSEPVDWRRGSSAASVTSNRLRSIYLLGSFFIF